jgi:hypothetical protein
MPPEWPPRYGWSARLRHAIDRAALRRRGIAEIVDVAALRERLGRPESILCLGNGPSSEGDDIPRAYDRLFRVNWVWQARGFLTEPDLVFTADSDRPPPGSRAILAFPTRGDAGRVLRPLIRQGARPPGYCVVPGLLRLAEGQRWPAFPSNGALMLAVAVALNPARLCVAGMDLYSHAGGKYPGAAAEPNRYDDIHDRVTELGFITEALSQYRGDLIVVGEVLQAALAKGAPAYQKPSSTPSQA